MTNARKVRHEGEESRGGGGDGVVWERVKEVREGGVEPRREEHVGECGGEGR